MGLRLASMPFGLGKGIGMDCMVCHAGSIAGKSYVGLGNSTLDYQAFYEEMSAADGRARGTPFHFCNVRGTNEAGSMAVYLLGYREPNLDRRIKRIDLDLQDDLCEDVPAWWLLKKKKTMYHTGGTDARTTTLGDAVYDESLQLRRRHSPGGRRLQGHAAHSFCRCRRRSIPCRSIALWPRKARDSFQTNCARCHGTYGEKCTYPNKVVPLDKISTDRRRFDGITRKFGAY